ncbi:malonic semialdehyde reductase [Limihaloglobus sulfuriphilus]|uniref:Malonic semialdehyde reductase n=1 Tax=Limihaloglobus sulfuriphilus TaxID=1851148 RepID=A0A1Q2MAD1_9BACT|nr:nitroreductase family protein [Limihaloglobus sulfuriphilus]AQQ69673.1 malonic semialdehyde reductase [Limihaloglobus sulfuriphilus]
MNKTINTREIQADTDPIFPSRWSPRSFSDKAVDSKLIEGLFEAARWATSCYNDQPWRFVYAVDQPHRQKYAEALVEQNRVWAAKAPVIGFVLCTKNFSQTGKPNRHAAFDAGSAWMSLALQAHLSGLYAHGMAGFIMDKAYEVTGADREKYDIMAAFVVGYKGDPEDLPEQYRDMESPNTRIDLKEIMFENQI